MSEYTPTTAEIRNAYWQVRRRGYWGHQSRARDEALTVGNAEFDRWLAARDAEVRDTQADYDAIRINDLDTRLATAKRELAEVREHARHEFCDPNLGCVATEEPEWDYAGTFRRRAAGKWEYWAPVKQEGESDE